MRVFVPLLGVIAGIVCAFSAISSTMPGMVVLFPIGLVLAAANFVAMVNALADA